MITLFHSPNVPASVRVQTLLKQAHGQAASHATEDQASSHDPHGAASRNEFELEVTEADPTSDQLRSMLEYSGAGGVGQLVEGASSEGEAMKQIGKFRRPVTVDWEGGRVVVGDKESEILKMIKELPQGGEKA